MVLVLALLGCTAAAFAVTEGLKLEKSPITDTKVDKVVAPDSASNSIAGITFVLRRPDRLTVQIVNGNGNVIRTLERGKAARRGTQYSAGTDVMTKGRSWPTAAIGPASISRENTARSGSRT